MVSASRTDTRSYSFVLRPNQSLTWRQTQRVYCGIVVVCGLIAMGFTAIGMWPVLPFAGAELLALGAGFYVAARRGMLMEVVRVDENAVAVEKGRRDVEEVWTVPRAWVRVKLRRSRNIQHPSQLVLSSHGREVRLGDFLCEEERHSLAADLRQALTQT